jgi:hypothetical protein
MYDPHWNNVVLLCSADVITNPHTFIDNAPIPHTLTTVSTAVASTEQRKFGAASLKPVLGRVDIANSDDFAFGAGDFTIEGWVYPTGQGSPLLNCQATVNSFIPLFFTTATNAVVYSANYTVITAIPFTANTWSHYAFVRTSLHLRVWINGVNVKSADAHPAETYGRNTKTSIGGSSVGTTHSFRGYVDEIRITKGVARYTAPFTPRTAPFPRTNINYSLTGEAAFTDGRAATLARIWRHDTGAWVADVTPDPASGLFFVDSLPNTPLLVTIFKDGYRPLTHGPQSPHPST